MIDCHAHLFVDAAAHAASLPDPLRRAVEATTRVAGEAVSIGDTLFGLFRVERIAASRSWSPTGAWSLLDAAMGVALVPHTLLLGTKARLLDSMDRYNIEATVVIGSQGGPNDWLLAQAAGEPRLIPVAQLPEPGPAGYEAAFEELVAAGVRGFKIHPSFDGLSADHAAYQALFEVAQRHRRFVIIHTGRFAYPGAPDGGRADPERFRVYFERFPEVRVCLAHMSRDEPEQTWGLLRRFPQLCSDTSWQPAAVIRRALDRVGAARLVLGSDWPLLRLGQQGEALAAVQEVASDGELDLMNATAGRWWRPEGRHAA